MHSSRYKPFISSNGLIMFFTEEDQEIKDLEKLARHKYGNLLSSEELFEYAAANLCHKNESCTKKIKSEQINWEPVLDLINALPTLKRYWTTGTDWRTGEGLPTLFR